MLVTFDHKAPFNGNKLQSIKCNALKKVPRTCSNVTLHDIGFLDLNSILLSGGSRISRRGAPTS